MDNMITLQLTIEQAEMLKNCLSEALNSSNEVKAKWAKIFIDAINGTENKENE